MGLLGNALSFFWVISPHFPFSSVPRVCYQICVQETAFAAMMQQCGLNLSGMYGFGLQAKCQTVNPAAASFIFATNRFHDRNAQLNIY